jgi:hypothetical protein
MSNLTRGAGLAASALVLSLAACSSGGSAPPAASSPSGKMLGATFSGTIYVSTETTQVTKAFVYHVANVANCAAAAAKGDVGSAFKVPSPSLPEPEANVEVTGFHGPGTYPPAVLAKDAADTILLPGKSGTSQYVLTSSLASHSRGKEVLFLAKNGSGQLVYSDAHLNGNASNPAIAGLIQWSCKS